MTDSTIVAADLAFLLPEPLNRAVTAINRTLLPPPDGFRFDATNVPHLTIVQQFVRHDALGEIGDTISQTVAELDAVTLVTTELATGRVACTLGVVLTAELAALHRRLLDDLAPFQEVRATPDAFWTDGDQPRPADVEWVEKFRQHSAGASFVPHITVGVGSIETTLTPSRFVASEVALCQLGRFCTCRRVLGAWTLTDSDR